MSTPRINFVIPVFNQLAYTTQCLESLSRAAVGDQDIIVINNGSTDGTGNFLAQRPNLRVISNDVNRGCSVAWNQGVEASTADWTMILNNDVVVAPGFCEGLVSFADTGYDIVSPAAGEGDLDYEFLEFAGDFQKRMSSACRPDVASGCAFMVSRRVFDAIGTFDTRLGLAGNEDEDFFRRARAAGFRVAVTGRAYLHHFSSVTQRSVKRDMGLPTGARLADMKYFQRKHNLTWLRRRTDRVKEKTRRALWCRKERKRFGLTLSMLRLGGTWRFR